ncbi:DUF4297 domain-containing protein [Aeromonas sp. 1HA1]|uniref:DUF4297 domain-containing protein n=1 Tax=Aeromonas sp. 1HA1 TaxID=2699193 RepID=UPI0023DDC5EC|nr:DUF4297 domain-containing protein [Aeromonas sp. 1HA1]MDF2413938.1 DUF4297 domain-containing protein [Aeromonas sp. 1HA1]
MGTNILAEQQREKSGATTFAKYDYQYHWALCKLIDKQMEKKEFAIFIEFHEDVLVSNGLDVSDATFEFNQIKNVQKKYTPENLVKIDKDSNNSVLGKLLLSVKDKMYSKQVIAVNLVSSGGFSLPMKKDLQLEIISTGDLSDSCLATLKQSLSDEIKINEIPSNLGFIVPKMKIDNHREYGISKIAELVNSIYPSSMCNSVSIYRSLIDELHIKGSITEDYSDWDMLIEKKGITSKKLMDTISVYTKDASIDEIVLIGKDILAEMGFFTLKKNAISSIVRTIAMTKVSASDRLDIEKSKIINLAIENEKNKYINSPTIDFFNAIKGLMEMGSDSALFKNEDEISAYIIYELATL